MWPHTSDSPDAPVNTGAGRLLTPVISPDAPVKTGAGRLLTPYDENRRQESSEWTLLETYMGPMWNLSGYQGTDMGPIRERSGTAKDRSRTDQGPENVIGSLDGGNFEIGKKCNFGIGKTFAVPSPSLPFLCLLAFF